MHSTFLANFCFYLTIVVFLLYHAVFWLWQAPYLSENVGVLMPIIFQLLIGLAMWNLMVTSCTDPGIIPAASGEEARFNESTCSE